MAKIVEFDRFKVIKASAKEMFEAVGSPGICDYCSERPEHGYYIAVLNKWFFQNAGKSSRNVQCGIQRTHRLRSATSSTMPSVLA